MRKGDWRLVVLVVVASTVMSSGTRADSPPVVFKDVTGEVGLKLGTSAACWADFDNDGWVDLCASGGIWRNDKGKSFLRSGDAANCVAADFDNDGFVDLFSWSALKLLRNVDGTKFEPFELPELPKTVSRGACWGDFNSDGFVDLFVGGYEDWNAGITWPFVVLMNEKGKSFRVARNESRLRARGVTACDFDEDGDLDVYVSNYRLQPNLLWLNDGKGEFQEQGGVFGAVATSPGFGGGHSIGACWGDFDSDGRIDLFAGNFAHRDGRGDQPKSRFLRNLGMPGKFHFEDRGPCGVHYQESYATPSAGDYDNDGNLDLFFTTVYGVASFGRRNNPVLFRGNGAFAVTDVTSAAGLGGLPPTYQAAWADFDNDGDLDIVSGGKLFANQGTLNKWVKVRLTGDGVAVNRSAVGAQVRVHSDGKVITRQVESGTGEGNQNDLTLHFGLGSAADRVRLEILWPNGTRQTVDNQPLGQLLEISFQSDDAANSE